MELGDCVSLVHINNPESEEEIKKSISKAIVLLKIKLPKSIKSVIIKVNLCYYWKSSTGYTTNPKFVAGIIDYIREKYNNPDIFIAEADATAMKTKYAFKMLDYENLAKRKKVHLFNLSDDGYELKKVKVNNHEMTFKIPRLLLESKFIINVPVIKTMSLTYMSCAMKNLFGCIWEPRKIKYHPIINETIVGINKIIKPQLTIVDGLVASGHTPKRLNMLMASKDAFSIDWIVAQILGYNPDKIKYLQLSQRENIRTKSDIMIVGEDWMNYKKEFPHVNKFFLKWSNKLQLKLLSLYSKIVGDVIPPFLEAN